MAADKDKIVQSAERDLGNDTEKIRDDDAKEELDIRKTSKIDRERVSHFIAS